MALEKEKEVHALLEKSTISAQEVWVFFFLFSLPFWRVTCILSIGAQGNFSRALEEARECGKKERQLCKFREHNNLGETINVDLTYAVAFNLALW